MPRLDDWPAWKTKGSSHLAYAKAFFWIFVFKCKLIVCSFFTCFAQAGVFSGFEAHTREYASSKSDLLSWSISGQPSQEVKIICESLGAAFSYHLKYELFFIFSCIFVPDKILLSTSLNWSRWAFPSSGRTDWKCQRSPFVQSNTKSQSCTHC